MIKICFELLYAHGSFNNKQTNKQTRMVQSCALDSIADNAFVSLTALNYLVLTYNHLTEISATTFSGLTSLLYL